MLVACLALLVALGGTSVAAVKVLAPRNSVAHAPGDQQVPVPIDSKTPPKGSEGPGRPGRPGRAGRAGWAGRALRPTRSPGRQGRPGGRRSDDAMGGRRRCRSRPKKGSGVVRRATRQSVPAGSSSTPPSTAAQRSRPSTLRPSGRHDPHGGVVGLSDTVSITTTNTAGAAAARVLDRRVLQAVRRGVRPRRSPPSNKVRLRKVRAPPQLRGREPLRPGVTFLAQPKPSTPAVRNPDETPSVNTDSS